MKARTSAIVSKQIEKENSLRSCMHLARYTKCETAAPRNFLTKKRMYVQLARWESTNDNMEREAREEEHVTVVATTEPCSTSIIKESPPKVGSSHHKFLISYGVAFVNNLFQPQVVYSEHSLEFTTRSDATI